MQRVGSPEVQRSKLKEEAVAFYAQHNVTDALETLLNRMFLEKPQDVYGYMVSSIAVIAVNNIRT